MASSAASGNSDIEQLIKRVTSHAGVRGFIIINSQGIPIRHSFTEASRQLAVQYAALFQSLAMKTKSVLQEMDSGSELQLMRLRTHKDEILVVPDAKYILIIIQEPENYAKE